MKRIYLFSIFVIVFSAVTASAQSGGSYVITQSVISGGGGTSSGGAYGLSGTVGQPTVANSGGSPYVLRGGFWQADLGPTAALVSISGRVVGPGGGGIRSVTILLSDAGGAVRQARTNPLGYFQFDDVEAGQTYVLTPTHRTILFAPQLINVQDWIADLVISPVD